MYIVDSRDGYHFEEKSVVVDKKREAIPAPAS